MKRILMLGDSNTWGYDYDTYTPQTGVQKRYAFDERWPGIVQGLLGDGYQVIEDAFNSRTVVMTDPVLPHRRGLDSLEADLEIHAPLDLVVIQLGANEFKTMYGRSAGAIAFGMDAMVRTCLTPRYGYPAPQVLLIAPAPIHPQAHTMALGFHYGEGAYEKSLAIGEEYRIVAERRGIGFLDAGALGFELNTVDGVHYSKSDHKLLAAAVADKIRAMLG